MKPKATKEVHTSNSKIGSGDFYGRGIKNPIGKVVDSMMMNDMSGKKTKTAPKSLA